MNKIRWFNNGIVITLLFGALVVGFVVTEIQVENYTPERPALQVRILDDTETDVDDERLASSADIDLLRVAEITEELSKVFYAVNSGVRQQVARVDNKKIVGNEKENEVAQDSIDPQRVLESLTNRYPMADSALWLEVGKSLVDAQQFKLAQIVLTRLAAATETSIASVDQFSVVQNSVVHNTIVQSEVYFYLAKMYSATNELDKAIAEYQKILLHWPNHQASQINIGLILARANQNEQAIVEFEKAVSMTSGDRKAKALAAKGESLIELKRYTEAVESYQQSIQYRPAHAVTWRKLAEAQRLSGAAPILVLTTLDHALALEPDYLLALHDRARYRWSLVDTAGALSDLESLRQLAPNYTDGRWSLIHLYLSLGKSRSARKDIAWLQNQREDQTSDLLLSALDDIAQEHWDDAGKILSVLNDPASSESETADWIRYYRGLTDFYQKDSNPEAAIAALRGLFGESWLMTQSRLSLAEVYSQSGRYHESIDLLSKLREQLVGGDSVHNTFVHKEGVSPELNYRLGRSLYTDEQFPRAVTAYKLASDSDPRNSRYKLALALAQVRSEQSDDAVKTYESLLSMFPNHKIGHYNYAILLNKLGRTQQAVQHYQRVLSFDPDYDNALYNLALIMREQKDFAAAEELLNTLVAAHPGHYSGRELLAKTLADQKSYPAALQEINRLLTLQPGSMGARLTKVDILEEQGQLQTAAELLIALSVDHTSDALVTKLYNVGVKALQAGDLTLAEFCSRKVLSIDPNRDKALVNLTAVFNRTGRFHETIALLTDEVLVSKDNKKLVINLAEAHQQLGEHRQVIALLNTSSKNDTLSADAQKILDSSVDSLKKSHSL